MTIQVGIVMGSDSDLGVMKESAKVLTELGIESEIAVMSAHRCPDRAAEYAKSAQSRGLKVIIAAAGMAAHLAGAMAAHSALPIIGVPIKSSLDGMDALLATVQMPPGVPVATVAIDGARNAGILAAQIIGASNQVMHDKLIAFKKDMKDKVEARSARLEEIGYEEYLSQQTKTKV
ncbi:MAG: 5-(carboxyamino)imidazole ribonucleotide mutase [Candidatus Melainabacteria bacterium]|jgi:5-(carboxyamino)imidazole ribonucleotide mutase|nr:5-(carboxyamino)imidazole ribonucleotide mutase [Candidatus Melainabacteria bacterium]